MSISTRSSFGCSSWSSDSDVTRDSEVVKNGWASELRGRLQLFDHDVDNFIETLLPSATPFTLNDDVDDSFATYNPSPGHEVESYPDLLAGLQRLVSPFEDAKKLSFINTSGNPIQFPFGAFQAQHHHTKPNISVSMPRQTIRMPPQWQDIAMVIEAKGSAADDPFPRSGQEHQATIDQLAQSARSLVLAHGLLSAFVIGIYSTTVRLARFDHTCALVSRPFDIKTGGGARLVQKFFWHFTHPLVGATIVGADPTVMPLDAASQAWVKAQLQRVNAKNWQEHVVEVDKGRRMEVYDEKTGKCVPYLAYHVVDVNGRLFSRATMVWRAIADTRIWVNGKLVPDPSSATRVVRPQILKEAWRQVVRTAETKFYQRLDEKIPDGERHGLAKMVCGGDIGEYELQWWEETKRRRHQPLPSVPPRAGRGQSLDGSGDQPDIDSESPDDAPALGDANRASTFSSLGNAPSMLNHSPHHGPQTAENPGEVSRPDFPLPHPQHQTYSWRLVNPEFKHLERSHMRIVIDEVGRPLTEFKSTRELVTALRDAVKGHQQAWIRAGILHRDVSVGNILIIDEPSEDVPNLCGFLHDFDYSSMTSQTEEASVVTSPSEGPSSGNVLGMASGSTKEDPTDNSDRKERTGTYYFMAYGLLLTHIKRVIHDAHHDLESIYWILIWVVLRHTDCSMGTQTPSQLAKALFIYGGDLRSHRAKDGFVRDAYMRGLTVHGNEPLTSLISNFSDLVSQQHNATLAFMAGKKANALDTGKLTYEAVLEILDNALAPHITWPTNDWRRCTFFDRDVRTVGTALIDQTPEEPEPESVAIPNRGGTSASRKSRSRRGQLGQTGSLKSIGRIPSGGSSKRSRTEPGSGPNKRPRTTGNMGPPPIPQSTPSGSADSPTASASRARGFRSGPPSQPTRSSARLAAKSKSTS
ncbi:hypothetical protein PYCCODRAFT_1462170 [Trametes coccinea BRFM310]|uniref:Fungal-type protein kinase domain-containing protein n=1 Tax=Trametes coccinea (strain BRFM310) TaxID=1353009 RepID=A0A1Y2I715_TRAC3|nr:hypothetical protein PYCCODRAFT_1462170 [Trametes coccinea BRFM310]